LRTGADIDLRAESHNLQARAREIRYQFFESVKASRGFQWIATAHHQDDQIETILHQFLRGGGLAALRGILSEKDSHIRPLLPFRKAEIEEYAAQNSVPWRNDSSNQKLHYTRNKLRHELIPAIERIYPGFGASLLRRAPLFREAELLVRRETERMITENQSHHDGAMLLPIEVIEKSNIGHLLIWQWIKQRGFQHGQTAEILKLMTASSGSFVAANAWRVWKDGDYLALAEDERTPTVVEIHGVGSFEKLDFFISDQIPRQFERDYNCAWFDAANIVWPLILRPWKEGDKIQPFGMRGHQLISDLIQNKGVKPWRRTSIRVVESDGQILFVPGLRHSALAPICETTVEALCILLHSENDSKAMN
jgi:tRNA(Ile)-lysidine synthase